MIDIKTLIDGYRSFPGEHCGSVAMRGLLHHYCGLDLPEAAVFGLGAGAASAYMSGPGLVLEAADAWTEVSHALFAASQDESKPKNWDDAARHATRVASIEERLFGMLADSVA